MAVPLISDHGLGVPLPAAWKSRSVGGGVADVYGSLGGDIQRIMLL
jgi:hypothetical protein